MTDLELQKWIRNLELEIETWAKSRDLWHDSGFTNYSEHVDAEPIGEPIITILWSEGDLRPILNGEWGEQYHEEFVKILEKYGCWFELSTSVHAYIYCDHPLIGPKLRDYFRWQWICGLVKPDFDDIYSDAFEHFQNHPQDLGKLHWRKFEEILSAIFKNQGFETILGPGSNDGGVDLRLIQRDPVGDIMTYVQAKRYDPKYKIDLQAIQALHGVKMSDEVDKSLFVTTSDYLPSAKKFASRENVQMELKTSDDVAVWCRDATNGIIEDKSTLVSKETVSTLLSRSLANPRNLVVHAHSGVTMIRNSFALKIKETKHAVLLMALPTTILSHDGFGQRGLEVPDICPSTLQNLRKETVWRAKKTESASDMSFWDGSNLFSPWDGSPQRFDYCD